MNSPAHINIGRIGYRGQSRRFGGAINAHNIRGPLAQVPIQPGSWIYDVGTGGTAALSHLAFYQIAGNGVLSVESAYHATSTSGVRIHVPFFGTAFGLAMLKGQSATENGGAFEMIIDGIVYPGRRDSRWLASIDTSGMGTLNHSGVAALAEDLDDGQHVAQLIFPGPRAAGTQNWYIGAWLLDRNAGYMPTPGLRPVAQLANARTDMPTSSQAIYTMTGANTAQAIHGMLFYNNNAGAQTITIQINNEVIKTIPIAGSSAAEWWPGSPITVASSLSWQASSADVKYLLLGAS